MCKPQLLLLSLVAFLLLTAGCTNYIPVPVVVPVADFPSSNVEPSSAGNREMPGQASAAAHTDTAVNAGAATPEEAIAAYMDAFAATDLDAMLATTAVDLAAERFDFVAYVDRLGVYNPLIMAAPGNDAFLVELNRTRFTQQLAGQISAATSFLLAYEPMEGVQGTMIRADGAWAEEVQSLLDSSRLADLRLQQIELANEEMMAKERYLEVAAQQARVWGGDEWTERLAHFTFEGEEYVFGFTLIRYGDGWYVQSQASAMAGTSASGVPIRR